MHRAPALLALAALTLATPLPVRGWGQPHLAITRGALEVLPAWQKELLGPELAALGDRYCMIPDHVFTDKENARFAQMESSPGVVYLEKLHLPQPTQSANLETVRYFVDKAVASWKTGATGDAARYLGTLCHLIEDFGSPSHTLPRDNMFTLFQQFLPPTERMQGQLLHGPVENGDFTVSLGDYPPQLLGTSVAEASWHLLHRIHQGILNARSTTLPIIQALYAGDDAARVRHQLKAATVDGQIVADLIHTVICLGTDRFDPDSARRLDRVTLSELWPVEAEHLYYPQAQFFSQPYWGHPAVNAVLENGTTARPLRLRVTESGTRVEKAFAKGLGVGMGKTLSFHLPKGVYRRFTALAGLQAGLGDTGRVEFIVLGDDQPLFSQVVSGTDAAQAVDCDISAVTVLQLRAESRGLNPKSHYAVWADPSLHR